MGTATKHIRPLPYSFWAVWSVSLKYLLGSSVPDPYSSYQSASTTKPVVNLNGASDDRWDVHLTHLGKLPRPESVIRGPPGLVATDEQRNGGLVRKLLAQPVRPGIAVSSNDVSGPASGEVRHADKWISDTEVGTRRNLPWRGLRAVTLKSALAFEMTFHRPRGACSHPSAS